MGTTVEPDLATASPVPVELIEGEFSLEHALGNTSALPGYTKEELCCFQDADPSLTVLKHFWKERRKPSGVVISQKLGQDQGRWRIIVSGS